MQYQLSTNCICIVQYNAYNIASHVAFLSPCLLAKMPSFTIKLRRPRHICTRGGGLLVKRRQTRDSKNGLPPVSSDAIGMAKLHPGPVSQRQRSQQVRHFFFSSLVLLPQRYRLPKTDLKCPCIARVRRIASHRIASRRVSSIYCARSALLGE